MAPASTRLPALIPRALLRTELEQVRSGEVLLAVAPIGYGKSTLFKLWDSLRHVRSVTFAVADRHADPRAFAADFARAIGAHHPEALELAGVEPDGRWEDEMLRILGTAPGLVLVDDAHKLGSAALGFVKRLVVDTPPTLMVGIASRTQVNVGVTRARREGRLRQIAPDELLFKPVELRALRRVGLSDEVLEEMYRETGGWPLAMGLSLAARVGSRPADDRQVLADLLREEVYPTVSEDQLLFLAQAARVAPADGPLLDAARESNDSVGQVRHFSQNPFPLVVASEAGIAFHPVMRTVLVNELRVRAPGTEGELLKRASLHLQGRGKLGRAFKLLEASGDRTALARFAYETGRALALSGQSQQVRSWIRAFTSEELDSYRELAVLCAGLEGAEGNFGAMAEWLVSLDGVDPGPVIREEMGPVSPIDLLRELIGLAPEGAGTGWVLAHSSWWSVMAWLTRAFGLLGTGELMKAEGVLVAMAPLSEPLAVVEMWRNVCLAYIFALREDYESGQVCVERAVAACRGAVDGSSVACVGVESVVALYGSKVPELRAEAHKALDSANVKLRVLRGTLPRRSVLIQVMIIEAALGLKRNQIAIDIVKSIRASEPEAGNEFLVARIKKLAGELRAAQTLLPEGVDLSAAELRVLTMLAMPVPVPLIAQRLERSPATVRAHARAIFKKLGVHRRSEAVQKAITLGLVSEGAMGDTAFDDDSVA